ncbi:hypothetical protein SAMN05421538_101146 [Paracoccus isoporae]|uniref:Uncharacterized protein n=1 Tax=Paracoccus isoporae TaxID=591205 RepID=A0A1G6SZM5_9RHOB|nr:hypothetical protein [Paracoccus isoporae]SDD22362.1 hypothetical protein SAMN05421538_101146 [Paracoccus isoporae]
MSEQTIATALANASETDKAEFAHYLADHALQDSDAARIRALVAAFDRFVAERLRGR